MPPYKANWDIALLKSELDKYRILFLLHHILLYARKLTLQLGNCISSFLCLVKLLILIVVLYNSIPITKHDLSCIVVKLFWRAVCPYLHSTHSQKWFLLDTFESDLWVASFCSYYDYFHNSLCPESCIFFVLLICLSKYLSDAGVTRMRNQYSCFIFLNICLMQ